jgi:hypothetical protein
MNTSDIPDYATLEGENAILKEELERTQKEAHHFY